SLSLACLAASGPVHIPRTLGKGGEARIAAVVPLVRIEKSRSPDFGNFRIRQIHPAFRLHETREPFSTFEPYRGLFISTWLESLAARSALFHAQIAEVSV